MAKSPLIFTYYIAAPIEKVWDGFVSKDANQKIFMGADFEVDLKPGGSMTWSGPGADGKPTRYVTGRVVKVDAPRLLEYDFGMGMGETNVPRQDRTHARIRSGQGRSNKRRLDRRRYNLHTECRRMAPHPLKAQNPSRNGKDLSSSLIILQLKSPSVWRESLEPISQMSLAGLANYFRIADNTPGSHGLGSATVYFLPMVRFQRFVMQKSI